MDNLEFLIQMNIGMSVKGEIWKKYKLIDGKCIYGSNMGRIKNISGKITLGHIKSSGYFRLPHKSVHRIIAKLFISNPQNKSQVNHISGVTTDNRVTNLEWVTPSQNSKHAIDNNLRKNDKRYSIKVIKKDLQDNPIKVYNSIQDAKKDIKGNGIQECCEGKFYTSGGYRWEYFNEIKKEMFIKQREKLHKQYINKQNKRKIDQYSKEGKFIKTWNSCMEIERTLGIGNSHISRVCRGVKDRKTAGGFIWKYHDKQKNDIKIKNELINKNKITKYTVYQMDKSKNILKIWKSASQAAKELNISRFNISLVCNNKKELAGGYKWKYAKK